MDIKKVLAVVAVILVVILGVWYFMSKGATTLSPGADQNSTGDASSQNVSGSGTTSGSGSIGSLLALGKNLQCSITTSTGGAQTEGVIYLAANGHMRGDFSTATDGNVVNATTINDGKYVYSWTNLSKQGFKATVAASGSTGAGAHGGVDNSAALKYSCKAWSPDAAKFVPPSTIKF